MKKTRERGWPTTAGQGFQSHLMLELAAAIGDWGFGATSD